MNRILVISCADYPGRQNDLTAPGLDADRMARIHALAGWEVMELADAACTTTSVRSRLSAMLSVSRPGERARTFWTGHGSWSLDVDGDEDDGRDETICLYDRDLVDDEINSILLAAPPGVLVDVVSDCCHGGTNTRLMTRSVPPPEALPRFRPPLAPRDSEALPLRSRFWLGRLLELFAASAATAAADTDEPVTEEAQIIDDLRGRLVLSACASDEVSYEVPSGGVFTTALHKLLIRDPDLTWRQIHERIGLPNHQFAQTPQLEGDLSRFDERFLG